MRLWIPGLLKVDEPLPALQGSVDFFGMNYYTRYLMRFAPRAHGMIERRFGPGERSDMNWEIYPEGQLRMLKKAWKKVRKYGLTTVRLMEMDASRLAFEDNAFDYVVAAFVISVVPDPVRVISEMKRVAKPDGRIVIINHFQSQNRIVAKVEEWVSPLCTRLGWHSDVDLEDLVARAHLAVDSKYQLNKLDLWKVVYAHK